MGCLPHIRLLCLFALVVVSRADAAQLRANNIRGKQTQVIIELPHDLYARTFAERSPDSGAIETILGTFGWQHQESGFFFGSLRIALH